MNKLLYRPLLGICLIFALVLGACSPQSQKVLTVDKTTALPAIEIEAQNKISPIGGISLDKVEVIVVQYIKDIGVKGDIQSNVFIEEITIKEAWENLNVQLYKVQLDYGGIYGIAVIKDSKILSMISGIPLFEAFLGDLDLDSKYEIYANTSFGSGIVSDDINGYNIVTNAKYYLSERMKKDFKLFVKENILMVKEYPYGNISKDFDTSVELKDLKLNKGKLVLEKPTYGFAIYKVKADSLDKALNYGMGESIKGDKIDLSKINIESTPLITERDIEKYKWESNTIVLNADFLKEHELSKDDIKLVTEKNKSIENSMLLSFYGGSKLLNCSDTEAVLIVVGEDKIYPSRFAMPAWSSYMPEIYIQDFDLKSIRIRSIKEFQYLIQDQRIYDFFNKLGKLDSSV